LALLLVTAIGILILFLGGPPAFAQEPDKTVGIWIGIVTGLLWVAEISFNNFVDPLISTGHARFYVDNGIWALIVLVILATAIKSAFNAGKIAAGVRVGLWSGLISGIIACLLGLSLILFWMKFLLRDPLNISEYAFRAKGAPESRMAAYFAYETMAGSLGHLFALGIGMGLILGLLGGLVGGAFAKMARKSLPA
jgi:hypothetical protein